MPANINSFQKSFDSHLGQMGEQMGRFFGGADGVSKLYKQAFEPLYASANSFAPDQQSFSPVPSGMGGTISSFKPSFGRPADSFSRFQPTLDPKGMGFLQSAASAFNLPSLTGTTPTTGGAGSAGASNYAALDAHNNEINTVASRIGVPANLLKSMINRESSGDWSGQGSHVVDPDGYGELVGFVGVRRAAAASVGINFDQMIGNKALQIEAMARILKRDYDNYGSWESAASNYLTGNPNAWQTGGTDSKGLRADYYVQKAMELWHQLDGSSAGMAGTSNTTTPANTQSVLSALQTYVGTPYVWGSAPGKGTKPTGWDCSGMTWWLDQNYGDGSLPQGSHYQYAYAQNTGKLFTDTGQLQAGDLMFFDTGWRGGGGANMNGASHVGIYLGNGKMIEAANPSAGTIISDISGRLNGQYMGAMHQSFSGGGAGVPLGSGGTGTTPSLPANIFTPKLRNYSNPFSSWQDALGALR